MRIQSLRSPCVVLLGLFASSCNQDGAGHSSGEATKVKCHDSENSEFCYGESCKLEVFDQFNDAAYVCSMFLNGDADHLDDYPNAEFDGLCSEEEKEDQEADQVPCICNWGDTPPGDDICMPQETGGGGDGGGGADDGGTPTTGDPEWDTGGPFEELWICSPSAGSNCQTRSGSGAGASDPACWQPTSTPPSSECVFASDYATAVQACQCLCLNRDKQLTGECNTEDLCEVDTALDCALTDEAFEAPVLDAQNQGMYACTNTKHAAEVSCPSTIKLFDASVSVVLADGTNSSVTGLVGYLDYSVSSCVSNTCVFDLSTFLIPHRDISGIYVQGTTTGTYSLDDLFVQMDGSLSGNYNQLRKTVTFPTGVFNVSGNVSGITLNSTVFPPLAGERITLSTSQVVGSLNSTSSPLHLNFIFTVPGGTATVSLVTR